MDGLKPCPLDEARKVLWYCAQFTDNTHWAKSYRKALTDICDELDRRAAPENKPLTCEGCKREGERDCWCRRAPKFRALPDDHYEPRRPEDAT